MKNKNIHIDPEALHDEEIQLQPDADNSDESGIAADDKLAQEDNALKELEDKFNSLNDSYLRLHAEFDNFRKRTLREKTELSKSATQEVIYDLLPVLDDFDRALRHSESTEHIEALREGEKLIFAKLITILEQKGLQEIKSIGEPFNTDLHDAITQIPAPSGEMKGRIIDETVKGYMLNGKVIRYAKVVVAG